MKRDGVSREIIHNAGEKIMQSEVDVDIYFPVVNQDRKYKICTSVKTTFGKV